jgi:hypothetical protein
VACLEWGRWWLVTLQTSHYLPHCRQATIYHTPDKPLSTTLQTSHYLPHSSQATIYHTPDKPLSATLQTSHYLPHSRQATIYHTPDKPLSTTLQTSMPTIAPPKMCYKRWKDCGDLPVNSISLIPLFFYTRNKCIIFLSGF